MICFNFSRILKRVSALNCSIYNFGRNNTYFSCRLLTHPPNLKFLACRYIFERREVNERVEEKFKKKDLIPDNYRIIYRAPLFYYIKFAYSMSFISLVGIPIIFINDIIHQGSLVFPIEMHGLTIVNNYMEFLAYIAGLTLIAFNVGITVFKYPLRLYNNKEEGHYIVVFQHVLPWKHAKKEFYAGEINKHNKGIMPWKEDVYKFNNNLAIFYSDHFFLPNDYNAMFVKRKKT